MTQFEASLIATDAAERERFLDALRATGCVSAAARATGTTRSTAYALRRRDPEFAAAWAAITGAAATARAGNALEAALIARATHGSERYRFLGNGGVEIWREFDHRLGLQLLRKLKPARYGDAVAAAAPVRTMTRAEFLAAIEARPRTVELG
jgi:hypothetical protein